MMMMRSQKSLGVTVGPFFFVDMQLFLKVSYSPKYETKLKCHKPTVTEGLHKYFFSDC